MPTSAAGRRVAVPPLNRYSPIDDRPRIVALLTGTPSQLSRATGLSGPSAQRVARAVRGRRRPVFALAAAAQRLTNIERVGQRTIDGTRLAITDVQPENGRILSDRPFRLRVSFLAVPEARPNLVRVAVEWVGSPFVVEARVSPVHHRRGFVDVVFDSRRTLPRGRTTFRVSLFNARGAKSMFRATCAVLPSNPFSLDLSPNASFVTGTFSARGVRNGSAFDTGISVTLSNGDGSSVGLGSGFQWRFWDGGVGGALVESGNGDFGVGHISVPAFGTWGGWIAFHSPSGSGVFNKYAGREDMTVEIIMSKDDGSSVSGTITCRTMFRFGVNVTRVAGEDFTAEEYADLWSAVGVLRNIYERHDVTFDTDDRYIPVGSVGGYETIDTFDEAHDLWSDWSGPDTNDNIDAFIVQLVAIPTDKGTADGVDGAVPGPTSHDGSDSGVVANKAGFMDGATRRLHVDYLGMLMGHELGHYLGLEHATDDHNLMLWNSAADDTDLTYDQYRTIIRHGWVFID